MTLKDFLKSEPAVLLTNPQQIEWEPFRPCEADGRPAFFHRWVQDDKALLQMRLFVDEEDLMKSMEFFYCTGVAKAGTEIEKISQTFALVEYEDGTVGKVEPEKIKFTDREADQ